jgi:YjbE family integral membrane protein
VAPVTINPEFLAALIQIIWINIILSGDNAVVIAMACRDLPAKTKNKGIILGAAAAIFLRIIFSFAVTYLMALPFLRVIGGLLLFWIAFDLLNVDDGHGKEIKGHDKLFHAVQTIAIADVVMSLDNVLAIAAIAKDDMVLLVLGLLISIPLIIAGSSIILEAIKRFPILLWAGAGLLGWLAGGMMIHDVWLVPNVAELPWTIPEPLDIYLAASLFGALFVLVGGYWGKTHKTADV